MYTYTYSNGATVEGGSWRFGGIAASLEWRMPNSCQKNPWLFFFDRGIARNSRWHIGVPDPMSDWNPFVGLRILGLTFRIGINFNRDLFEVNYIHTDKNGQWYVTPKNGYYT